MSEQKLAMEKSGLDKASLDAENKLEDGMENNDEAQKNKSIKDLTTGSIPRHLVSFATPLLLGNVLQALYNTVDSIWVGKFLGPNALAAVTVGFPIIFILISFVGGIVMATTILVAQYSGARDEAMLKRTVITSFIVLSISAVVVTVIGLLFNRPILQLLNTPKELIDDANVYLSVFFGGMIFLFGYNVLGGILRGLGDSKTPLKFLAISTGINIVLDPLFIFGLGPVPGMGVAGAALATVIAQAVSFALELVYLNKMNHILVFKWKELRLHKDMLNKIIKIGFPIGIQQIVISLGIVVMMAVVNGFGTRVVAAYGAASRIDQFAFMPAMSMGAAVSAIAGQNIGANKYERVSEVVKWGSMFSVAITSIVVLIAVFVPEWLLVLFTDDPGVLEIGGQYLRIVGLAYIPFAVMFITNGVIQGAGDTLPTMVFTIIDLWVVRLPLAKILSDLPWLNEKGIFIAVAASSLVSFAASLAYYMSGRWKRKKIVHGEEMPGQDVGPGQQGQ